MLSAAPIDRTDTRALAAGLAREAGAEVRIEACNRAPYATDASNYRQKLVGVAVPRMQEDVDRSVFVRRRHGTPVVSRGYGTSVAGQTAKAAVARDFPKHWIASSR